MVSCCESKFNDFRVKIVQVFDSIFLASELQRIHLKILFFAIALKTLLLINLLRYRRSDDDKHRPLNLLLGKFYFFLIKHLKDDKIFINRKKRRRCLSFFLNINFYYRHHLWMSINFNWKIISLEWALKTSQSNFPASVGSIVDPFMLINDVF